MLCVSWTGRKVTFFLLLNSLSKVKLTVIMFCIVAKSGWIGIINYFIISDLFIIRQSAVQPRSVRGDDSWSRLKALLCTLCNIYGECVCNDKKSALRKAHIMSCSWSLSCDEMSSTITLKVEKVHICIYVALPVWIRIRKNLWIELLD